MACYLFGTNPLPQAMLIFLSTTFSEISIEI